MSSNFFSARRLHPLWILLLIASQVVGQEPDTTGERESSASPAGATPQPAAQATKNSPDIKELETLFRQLEASTQAAREEAERKLVAVGPEVLNHLPAITASTSAETKLRLARIQSELEKQYAASLSTGSTVTLNGKMTLSDALAQLQQQTGNMVVDFRPQFGQETTDPEIEVHIENVPYLKGLDQVLDAAKMDVYTYAGEVRRLAIIAGSAQRADRAGQAAYDGLFRFEAVSVGAERDLRNPENRGMRLSVEVLWEPKSLPLVISQPLDAIELTDSAGQPLSLEQTEGSIDIPVQSTIAGVTLDLPVALPDRSVQKIGMLRGKGRALVPGMNARFVFDQLGKTERVRQQKAGVAVTLESVRPNDEAFEFRVRLTLDNANPSLQSYLDWAANNVAYLEGPNGQRIDQPSFEKYLERENTVGYAYLLPVEGDLKDYRFVYETPSMILEVPFAYELRDVALP